MIRSYCDKGTRDIAAGAASKAARKVLSTSLHVVARKRLAFLASATSLDDLCAWPGLNFHPLDRDREGQYAIRINDQYRICFAWFDGDADNVEIADYH